MGLKYLKENLFLNLEDEYLNDISSEDNEILSDKESDIFKKNIISEISKKHAPKILKEFCEKFKHYLNNVFKLSKIEIEYDNNSQRIIFNVPSAPISKIADLVPIEKFAEKYKDYNLLIVLKFNSYLSNNWTSNYFDLHISKECPLNFNYVKIDVSDVEGNVRYLQISERVFSSKYDILKILDLFLDNIHDFINLSLLLFSVCKFKEEVFPDIDETIEGTFNKSFKFKQIKFSNCTFNEEVFAEGVDYINKSSHEYNQIEFYNCIFVANDKNTSIADLVKLPISMTSDQYTDIIFRAMTLHNIDGLFEGETGAIDILLFRVRGIKKISGVSDNKIYIEYDRNRQNPTDYGIIDFDNTNLPINVADKIYFKFTDSNYPCAEPLSLYYWFDEHQDRLIGEFIKKNNIDTKNVDLNDLFYEIREEADFWYFVYEDFKSKCFQTKYN